MAQGTPANLDAKCCTKGCDERRASLWASYCRECGNERQRQRGGYTKRGSRPVPESKACTRCGLVKSLSDFNRRSAAHDGRTSHCSDCLSAARRQWASRSGYATPRRSPRMQLADEHGLTVDEFDALLATQGGTCAICGTCEPGGRDNRWHVDHDHSLGCHPVKGSCGDCRRGLLCARCNIGLGYFKDDIDKLRAAIAYLGD